MTEQAIQYPTMIQALWRNQGLLQKLLLVFGGSLLLTASAKVSIPFYPVPMTMQTFVVLAIGFAYGWKLAATTVILYLAYGAFGLPVFAGTPEKGIGWAYMAGPTGGYLTGFILAAALCGWLAEKGWDRSISKTFAAMVLGNLVIYALGLLWLGTLLGWDKPILAWGLYPFLLGDLFKIVLAMLVIPAAWKVINKDKKV